MVILSSALRKRLNDLLKSVVFPPILVLICLVAVSLATWQISVRSQELDRSQEIFNLQNDIQQPINVRFEDYEQILKSNAAFVGSTPNLQDAWVNYVDQSGVFKTYPGILGVGYNAFDQTTPNGERSTKIRLIATFDNQNTLTSSFNMFSDPVRRAAMERAEKLRDSSMTSSIQLQRDQGLKDNPGYIIYYPLYEKPDDSTSIGYTYISFRARDLFSEIFRNVKQSDTHISIVQQLNGIDKEIFSNVSQSDKTRETNDIKLNILGQDFTLKIYYESESLGTQAAISRPQNVLYLSLGISLLISLIVYLIIKFRASEIALQKENEVNLAKDGLLSIASHELRTPATGVKQYIGLLMQGYAGKLTSTQRNFLDKAYASNERQLQTINDILYVARLNSGRTVMSPTKIDPDTTVKDAVEDLRSNFEEHSHKLTVKLSRSKKQIRVDSHMLRMIIDNLLTNAVKYTPDGGKINVSSDKSLNFYTLTVQDNGVGINDEDKKLLFKQFSRINNTMTSSTNGSGIGLYLTKELVELHGGTISVVSEAGKGSTFTVKIPNSLESR